MSLSGTALSQQGSCAGWRGTRCWPQGGSIQSHAYNKSSSTHHCFRRALTMAWIRGVSRHANTSLFGNEDLPRYECGDGTISLQSCPPDGRMEAESSGDERAEGYVCGQERQDHTAIRSFIRHSCDADWSGCSKGGFC